MRSCLQQLAEQTTIVADSSDLAAVRTFQPLDATTNPSLITAAAAQIENQPLILTALQQAKQEQLQGTAQLERAIDILTVRFGVEIAKLIQGRVSTEVDARLSFDTNATICKAHELLELYQQFGIDKQRVLIKIASTWQGIQAAKQLEQEGIHCNLTLLFNLTQAQACAEAKVTLISPFVGRILDWYKKTEQVVHYPIEQDQGVLSVQQIYTYYKQHGIKTQIMGASFRSTEQILALTGCDLLTIAPKLLQELSHQYQTITAKLSIDMAQQAARIPYCSLNEQQFQDQLSADPMAFELLHTGIEGFIAARNQLLKQLSLLI